MQKDKNRGRIKTPMGAFYPENVQIIGSPEALPGASPGNTAIIPEALAGMSPDK